MVCVNPHARAAISVLPIIKRMKQATLFGFLVLNMLIILCQSDWFASHQTVGLQEWFVQVNQRVLKQKILWRLQTQGGGG